MQKSCSTCANFGEDFQNSECRKCTIDSAAGYNPFAPDVCDQTETAKEVKTEGMDNETFTRLVEEIREKSLDTLLKKNSNYADADRLHNFRVGASIIGGTPAQAAFGYMAKHLASLRDKVLRNDFRDRDDLLEKCQDIINYVVFVWCCGNENEKV